MPMGDHIYRGYEGTFPFLPLPYTYIERERERGALGTFIKIHNMDLPHTHVRLSLGLANIPDDPRGWGTLGALLRHVAFYRAESTCPIRFKLYI